MMWTPERVLHDAAEASWFMIMTSERGSSSNGRRGRAPVDAPGGPMGEFVIESDGMVELPNHSLYRKAFPDPLILTAAARLTRRSARRRGSDILAK